MAKATRFTIKPNGLPFGIRLDQTGLDQFTVVYGYQVDAGLTYGEACDKLGQAIMHALACEGAIDNRSKREAGTAGDKRPYFNGDTITLDSAA